MGSNKFDGSRLWMADYWGWEDGMNPNDIKSIFDVGSRIRALRTTFPGHRTEYRVNTVYSIQCLRICDKDVKLFQRQITKQLLNFILKRLNKITNLILGKHYHQMMHSH